MILQSMPAAGEEMLMKAHSSVNASKTIQGLTGSELRCDSAIGF